jgi:hypothetical protein
VIHVHPSSFRIKSHRERGGTPRPNRENARLGYHLTDIAEAEAIGRPLASREANSPECRQLIAEFVGDEWEEMRAVFYRSMRAIEHALSARREYLTKDGQIMQGGPDHYARLAATKHFRDFLMASRPAVSVRVLLLAPNFSCVFIGT